MGVVSSCKVDFVVAKLSPVLVAAGIELSLERIRFQPQKCVHINNNTYIFYSGIPP